MPQLRDLYHDLKIIGGTEQSPTDNTAVVSPIVDVRDYEGILFTVATGTLADADATFTALLEESDASDLSGSNAVDDSDMIGTEAGASFIFSDDNKQFKLGYIGNRRYVRLTVTPAANSSAAAISILVVGDPLHDPAT